MSAVCSTAPSRFRPFHKPFIRKHFQSDLRGRNFHGCEGVNTRSERNLMRDDHALLQRLQAGDERAIGELVDTYGQRIYQLAFRYLRNREDAEEATQDVLFKVYRKVGAFRGDAALSSWIYRITFNTAMSKLRNTRLARQADQEKERALAASGEDRPKAPRQTA